MLMNKAGIYDEDWLGFDWSSWLNLRPEKEEIKSLSTDPGLYRVRHEAYDGLIYIGETGRSLSGRVHSLVNGIFDGEMPYSDPHTASPSMWAIRERHGLGFEVSGATPDLATEKQQRKAIEDALIALHRRETSTNLIGNFGRMPPGYSKSGQRSTRERGKKVNNETNRSFRKGVDSLQWHNRNSVTAQDWMGLSWSTPQELRSVNTSVPPEPGVYRIWDGNAVPPLEYIGESVNIRSRLKSHRNERDVNLLFSHTESVNYKQKFQLSQIESELLGAHWLACGESPRDQY